MISKISFWRCLIFIALFFPASAGIAQTTSWRGTSSTAWATASNWTNGVPTATVDAIIGDANFTGVFQPSVTATAACRALTIGGGAGSPTLTVNAQLTVNADLNIASAGTLTHTGNSVRVRGNWTRTGTYNPTVAAATVVFLGTTQSINSATTFNRLTINSGSTTSLAANITVTDALVVGGILDPLLATRVVTLTGPTFTINALGRVRVHASTFDGNYSINPTTLNARSIVEYASATIAQTVATFNYGTLTISGGSLKTLAGNTTLQSTSGTGGNVNVNAGTLDIGSFTLNRNAAGGGTFTVSNGAQLIIGGTNSFPANYNTTNLGATSTVVYSGNDQTIASRTYGNLTVNGASGTVTKTFAATAMTVAGNLSITAGTATSVVGNANAAITVNGNVTIGAATTFNGGASTHIVAGNWTNSGTYNGNTGTVRFNGASRVISGAGIQNFNNITVAGAGVTCSSTAVTLTGNLATTGAGTFTHNAGSTMTLSGTTRTIGGTGIVLSNVSISGSYSTTASFTIGGNLAVSGTFNATAGTVTFTGTGVTISGAGTTTFFGLQATGTVGTAIGFSMRSNLSGTGKLTATANTINFIGTSTVTGAHDLFNVTLNGTRLQLGANSTLGVAGALTLTAGTFNTTTTIPNTLVFNGPGAQNMPAATYHHLTLSGGGTKTALGALAARGNLTIGTGVTFNASTFTHTITGNWINQGSFTASTSTITFNGTTNTTLTGATTFNALTLNKSTATTTLTLNNPVNVVTMTMTAGRMLTGSNSITVTGNRTGNGIILGTITRTHAFVANTAYAFEGPFNTITFTSITGGSVTSVTVNSVSGPVADFPSVSSVSRAYTHTITNTGSYVATLRLHYEDTELNGNTEANLTLWKFITGTWTGLGRNSNSTTNNWVERTGQTDISGRWTFSDGGVTHIWKGTTSTAWTTAGNWKAGVVPLSNDNILIGTEAFTNQPAITTAIVARSVAFGSVQAVNLTIGGGAGSLTVNGNVSGDWLADQTHSINVGARTLTIAGDLILSNGNAARRINLAVSTGTATVSGSITQSGASSIVFSGNGNLNIGTDYNFTGGTFTPGTGTVTYNGAGDQLMAGGISHRNLNINKASGTAILGGNLTVDGNLTLTGSSAMLLNGTVDVASNVVTSAASTLDANGTFLRVGGNWTINGTFNPLTGSVVFNGTGNQSIAATPFNDLVINKASGVATPSANLVINGDLSITSGTLDLGSFTADRSTTGGTFTIGNAGVLRLAGTSNLPANYDVRSLAANSTVVYNGTSQNIAPIAYGNLVLSNAGTKSFLPDTLTSATNLTIDAAANLPATATLRLTGNFVNNTSLNAIAGSKVEFAGSSTQSISGTTRTAFSNIIVSNTASPGVTIESNQDLLGVLTLASNASIDADGSANASVLRLVSTADSPTSDGSIATLPSGAAVLGNVTVERFMSLEGPNSNRIYRYVSSPVQNATVADMQNEIPVTGTFTGSSTCAGCTNSASLFSYNETVTGGVDDGYVAFPVSGNTETFQAGRGYAMYVRGNLLTTALWDLRGPVNSGPITFPITFTSSGTTSNDGWNLVGNPYPSAIDWNAASGWTKASLSSTIYIRDNSGTGQYATWNGVTGTNGGSRYIAAGQAFWVKASGTSPSLALDENVKVAGTSTTFFRQNPSDNMVRVTLTQDALSDDAVIHFRTDATNEFDEEADAIKLPNAGFNLSTQLTGQDKLAINSLGFTECTVPVSLVLENLAAGTYQLSFENLNSFAAATTVTLADRFANSTLDVRNTNHYQFEVTSDPLSSGNTRFVLNFTLPPAPMEHTVTASPVCAGSDARVDLANTTDLADYQVLVNGEVIYYDQGTAGSASVAVPASMLRSGDNQIRVIAVPIFACGTPFETTTTLKVESIHAPEPATVPTVCNSGSTTITVGGAGADAKYMWYANADDATPLGMGASFQTPALVKPRTFFVSALNALGCESERVPVSVEITYLDPPSIGLIDDKLTVDFTGRKQWYFNGQALPNDTLSFIQPRQSGVYSVIVQKSSCTAEVTYPFVTTGLGDELGATGVFPNPTAGWLYFQDERPGIRAVYIENVAGQRLEQIVLTKLGSRTTGKADMSLLPPGLYFVVVESDNGMERRKVMKK